MASDSKRVRRPGGGDALRTARIAAKRCKACPLWRDAIQTVFGEGNPNAPLAFVGEQPGDAEDRLGRPFVGPAGRLLDAALAEAGLDRSAVYLTNVVKHFKWIPRGKRRIHKTPAQREIEACLPWLEQELAAVTPRLVICLGATALRAMLTQRTTIGAIRGRIVERPGAPAILVTVHPSYVLRVPPQQRGTAYRALVADLRIAARFIGA